eukprot:8476087-Ditylum_brightwellii.AAC.1
MSVDCSVVIEGGCLSWLQWLFLAQHQSDLSVQSSAIMKHQLGAIKGGPNFPYCWYTKLIVA